MAPVIKAQHAETAFAVTCVVLFGGIAMLFYPWVAGDFFAASPVHAGVFLGTSIRDTSQVIGSALIYSQQAGVPEALSAASVAKLLRNLSIVVLIPAASWLAQREERARRRTLALESAAGAEPTVAERTPQVRLVPFFVLAFMVLVIVRTAGDAVFDGSSLVASRWSALVTAGQSASEPFLICGMTAVGLSVSFMDLWRIGWRPLLAGFLLAPPRGHGLHHYHFRLAALDVARLDVPPDADAEQLWRTVQPHILAEAETVGTYER